MPEFLLHIRVDSVLEQGGNYLTWLGRGRRTRSEDGCAVYDVVDTIREKRDNWFVVPERLKVDVCHGRSGCDIWRGLVVLDDGCEVAMCARDIAE